VTLNTNLGPRRRRKRPRAKEEEINDENNDNKNNRPISTVKSTSNSIPNLDDSELTFLDCDGDFVADRRHNGLTSVANLLRERSLGKWRGRQSTWQQTALKYQVKKPMDGCPRRQWRMYCRRSIPFTQLGTPHSEAVLAMDRNGSFVLSLGGKDLRDIPLALAIRFFGKPVFFFTTLSILFWENAYSGVQKKRVLTDRSLSRPPRNGNYFGLVN